MRNEHRLDGEAAQQLQHLVQRKSLGLDLRQRILDAAWLRLAAIGQEVLAAAADTMRLLGQIHRLEPGGEGPHQIARQRRRSARDTGLQGQRVLAFVVTPLDGGAAVASTRSYRASPPCSRSIRADHRAQLMHVLAQREMLGRKLDLMAVHGAGILQGDRRRGAQDTGVRMTCSASPRSGTGFLMAGCGAVLFASKGLFVKALAAHGVDYLTMTTVRGLLALPLFTALALWRGVDLRRAPARALWSAALAGSLGYGVGALVDFRALELIDVSVERALLFTYPALIVGWRAIARRRRPRPRVLLALAATYTGILLVVGGFNAALWRQNLFGALLVLGCAACMACYFLLGERSIAALGGSGFTLTALGAAAGFVLVVFLSARPLTAVTSLDAHDWLLMIALAVLCMFLPSLFQAGAIGRIGAERGALASTVGPPVALLLGMLLLGERPGLWQLLGTATIVSGIVLIARDDPPL